MKSFTPFSPTTVDRIQSSGQNAIREAKRDPINKVELQQARNDGGLRPELDSRNQLWQVQDVEKLEYVKRYSSAAISNL